MLRKLRVLFAVRTYIETSYCVISRRGEKHFSLFPNSTPNTSKFEPLFKYQTSPVFLINGIQHLFITVSTAVSSRHFVGLKLFKVS
jgi:hypothetical protein